MLDFLDQEVKLMQWQLELQEQHQEKIKLLFADIMDGMIGTYL